GAARADPAPRAQGGIPHPQHDGTAHSAPPLTGEPRMPVERASGGSSLIDVLDRVLDKGIVIDAWVRVSLVGIDLITVEARVVVDACAQPAMDWLAEHAEARSAACALLDGETEELRTLAGSGLSPAQLRRLEVHRGEADHPIAVALSRESPIVFQDGKARG